GVQSHGRLHDEIGPPPEELGRVGSLQADPQKMPAHSLTFLQGQRPEASLHLVGPDLSEYTSPSLGFEGMIDTCLISRTDHVEQSSGSFFVSLIEIYAGQEPTQYEDHQIRGQSQGAQPPEASGGAEAATASESLPEQQRLLGRREQRTPPLAQV